MCSIHDLSNCNFSYYPLWFRRQDLGSDCNSSWSLLVVTFSQQHYNTSLTSHNKIIKQGFIILLQYLL